MLLSECVEDYLDDCYGLSRGTQKLYAGHLANFVKTVGDQPVDSPTLAKSLRHYMATLRRKDGGEYSPAYLDQVYRTLHTFFSWCVREEFMPHNPVDRVRRPRVPKRKSPRLDEDEVSRLLDAVMRGPYPERDLAMICLMVDSGLRRAEVIQLKIGNVNLATGVAVVFGKGSKEREVPLGAMTRDTLRRWLELRPPSASDALFLTRKGTPFTVAGLHTLVRRLKERAGLPQLHCHLLRHTFANWYISKGGSIRKLKEILGHASIQTTVDIYTSPELGELQEEHARVSTLSGYTLELPVPSETISFPS